MRCCPDTDIDQNIFFQLPYIVLFQLSEIFTLVIFRPWLIHYLFKFHNCRHLQIRNVISKLILF